MRLATAPHSLPSRDVYRTRGCDRHGNHVLYALDSRGWFVAKIVLWPGVDEEAAERKLFEHLDRVDPVPQLRLVRGPAQPPRLSPGAAASLYRFAAARRAR